MTVTTTIGFNKPYLTGKELDYIQQAHAGSQLAGDGSFTKRCSALLESLTGSPCALLTHSCTAALEMAALLLDIQPGDEVIMPSFTFVSTANAFVLRGGVPVFVDIRPDTLNLDESLVEGAITTKTKAIVVVHYAGVACEMDTIMAIATRHGLPVVEDAAQALLSTYKGRPLGSIGTFGTLSFHETKNVISGEGGALLVNDPAYFERAEIIREKGTDRSRFFRGQVDKYTWVDIGSSYLPGEIVAAFLLAQLERAGQITRARLAIWSRYQDVFFDRLHSYTLPTVPANCTHNAHMYYVLAKDLSHRQASIQSLRSMGIHSVFHYVPLHNSPAGIRFGRCFGSLSITERCADRLLRLPLWLGLDETASSKAYTCLSQTTA
jgi:dTDP-4-amino-4,6-dideoxygalactose transaminase